MASTRPKRKAASNKNYTDLVNDAIFKEIALMRPEKPAPKKTPSSTPSKTVSPSPPVHSLPQNGVPKVPYNWQPPLLPQDFFSNKLDLEGAYVDTTAQTLYCPSHQSARPLSLGDSLVEKLQKLISSAYKPAPALPVPGKKRTNSARERSSAFHLSKGDYIYMISEPPGEPYYIGRIMGFKHKDSSAKATEPVQNAKDFEFLIQWFYRPRDISKHSSDSRLLYASMHSDTCPLVSFRGTVTVKHKLEIDSSAAAMENYVTQPNCFYFDKLFDRYMIKFYDIVKTLTLLPFAENAANDSKNYILALNKRFEFVFMETLRTKPFVNNFGSNQSPHCELCGKWCYLDDSVLCSGCDKHFHMYCLDPPLLKKPSRGFSWTCAKCAKKHELEQRRKKIVMLSHDNRSSNEQELLEVDSNEDLDTFEQPHEQAEKEVPKYEKFAIDFLLSDIDVSVAARRLEEEWCMRYLGVHTRLEDAVDPEDRSPYPRASTNLGAKYQAMNVPECDGHPLVYYDTEKTANGDAKAKKTNGKKTKKPVAVDENIKKLPLPKEFESVPPLEYPPWLQPRPKGYIERGVDDGDGETVLLMWKSRDEDKQDDFQKLDNYIAACEPFARNLDIFPNTPNFMDALLKIYMDNNGDTSKSIDQVSKLTRKSLNEPTFNKEEIKRFEAGVKKYGSELYPTYKEVKTQPCSMVVRFYYLWKKTKRGRQIWGNFPGRKKAKTAAVSEQKVDDYADTDDDSSYETEKIVTKKRLFRCKHCSTYRSLQWFKITGFDGNAKYDDMDVEGVDRDAVTALCFRCAKLWRRYAVYWEDPLEVEKKYPKTTGGYKRKVEAELMFDAQRILAQADKEGGGLCYDSDKSLGVQGSILFMGPPVNGTATIKNTSTLPKNNTKPAAPKPLPRKANEPAVKQEPLETPPPKKKKTSPVENGTKKAEKKEEKIVKLKMEPKGEQTRKRPQTPEVKKETAKKPRKLAPTDTSSVVSAVFNENYRYSLPLLATIGKIDKKLLPALDKDILTDLVHNYKAKQLLDLKLFVLTKPVENKEEKTENKECPVCEEQDSSEWLLSCAACEIKVHGSCAGISGTGKQKTVKHWMCEPCTNGMHPHFSSSYKCCLCSSSETKLLVPIIDSGKWCHLSCALFSHPDTLFRNLQVPSFVSKDILATSTARLLGRVVESVNSVFLENFKDKCGICHTYNGAMMKCDLCEDKKFHINCVQHTEGFRLGFRVAPQTAKKPTTTTFVGDESGKLEPVLICSAHSDVTQFYRLRDSGRRTQTGELKPLVSLYYEDITRTLNPRENGPQQHASNYVSMIEKFARATGYPIQETQKGSHCSQKCLVCSTESSPIWNKTGDSVKCHSCFQTQNTDEPIPEGDILEQELCRPLDGTLLGIPSPADFLPKIALNGLDELVSTGSV